MTESNSEVENSQPMAHLNRRDLLLGQFGKSSLRRYSKSMLLDLSDIPEGNWKVTDSSWRVGSGGNKASEFALRARKIGNFISVRSFEQIETKRTIVTQVIPYAAEDDAQGALPLLLRSSRSNLERKKSIVREEMVSNVDIPGAFNPSVTELFLTGDEGPSVVRRVVGNVENVAFLVVGSGSWDGWPLDKICSVASLQAERIQKILRGQEILPSPQLVSVRRRERTRLTIFLLALALLIGGIFLIPSRQGNSGSNASNSYGATSAGPPYNCPVTPAARVAFNSRRPPMEIMLIWSVTSNTAATKFIKKYEGCLTYTIAERGPAGVTGVPPNSDYELAEFWADASKAQINGVTEDFENSRLFSKVADLQTLRCPGNKAANLDSCVRLLGNDEWAYETATG
jgi:hypothetical protein